MNLLELLADLGSDSSETRLAAMREIARGGGLRALPVLEALAGADPSPEIRRRALRALEQLRRQAAESLERRRAPGGGWPADASETEWNRVVFELVFSRDAQAARFLEQRLARSASAFLRAAAALGLGALRDGTAIPTLLELLKDPDPRVRARAAEALACTGGAAADEALEWATASDMSGKLARAVELGRALRSPGTGASPVAGPREESLDASAGAASSSAWAVPQDGAVLAGRRLASRSEEEQLLFWLESDSDEQKLHACRLLEELGQEAALEPLFALMTARDPELRYAAGKAFNAVKARAGPAKRRKTPRRSPSAPMTSETLTLALRNRDPRVRLDAAMALGPSDRHLLALVLAQLERESDVRVQATLVRAVGAMGDATVVPKLAPFLKSPDDRVRANSVEALATCAGPAGLPYLVPFLQDPSGRTRANASLALRQLDPARSLDTLKQMAAAEERWMRDSAAYALGELGTPEALEVLYGRLEQEQNPHVTFNLLAGVCRIGSEGRAERLRRIEERSKEPRLARLLLAAREAVEAGRTRLEAPEEREFDYLGLLSEIPFRAPAGTAPTTRTFLADVRARLENGDAKVRQEAALDLSRRAEPEALGDMLRALRSGDLVVRYLMRRELETLLEEPGRLEKLGGARARDRIRRALALTHAGEPRGPASSLRHWGWAAAVLLTAGGVSYALWPSAALESPAALTRQTGHREHIAIAVGAPRGRVSATHDRASAFDARVPTEASVEPTLEELEEALAAELSRQGIRSAEVIRLLALDYLEAGYRAAIEQARNAARNGDLDAALELLEKAFERLHPDHLLGRHAILHEMEELSRRGRHADRLARTRQRTSEIQARLTALCIEAAREAGLPEEKASELLEGLGASAESRSRAGRAADFLAGASLGS